MHDPPQAGSTYLFPVSAEPKRTVRTKEGSQSSPPNAYPLSWGPKASQQKQTPIDTAIQVPTGSLSVSDGVGRELSYVALQELFYLLGHCNSTPQRRSTSKKKVYHHCLPNHALSFSVAKLCLFLLRHVQPKKPLLRQIKS